MLMGHCSWWKKKRQKKKIFFKLSCSLLLRALKKAHDCEQGKKAGLKAPQCANFGFTYKRSHKPGQADFNS